MPSPTLSPFARRSSIRGLAALIVAAFATVPPSWATPVPCVDGFAGPYPCHDVDLQAMLPMSEIGGGRGSDVWGWTDPASGREYVIFIRSTGTAFVDLTEPAEPVYLGDLPPPGEGESFGDVKVYRGFAFIVGERAESGLQVFDLRRLRSVANPPSTFTADAHFTDFGRAHNLALNEESGFAYAVNANECGRGLYMIDVRDPLFPSFAGCVPGPTHDAQCVTYRGPDPDYRGREICFNSNEDHVGVADVTDKDFFRILSRTHYEGSGYTHQGWLTEDHAFFLVDDESDERNFVHNTRTYVFNVEDLDAPFLAGVYTGPTTAIDHNLYVSGNHVFEANYRAGLRILHLDDVRSGLLSEVGYFDVAPASDAREFGGAWTAYPFFASGNVVVGAFDGLYVVRPTFAFGGEEVADCPLAPGAPGFCRECGPCRVGQGSCRTDDECGAGLVCAEDFGGRFGLRRRAEVCVVPGRHSAPAYAATELPALAGGLDSIAARALNDAGQVTGEARSAERRSAFRFTPGSGMEKLDPRGDERSSGWTINEAGDVFGYLYAAAGERQTGFFVHRQGSGFDLLGRGANGQIRQSFELRGMNGAGDLAGSVFSRARGVKLPYLYTAEDGWTPLAGIDPRFGRNSTAASSINDAGDLLFVIEHAGDESEAFVLFGGDDLVELGDFGRRFNLPGALNDNGRVAGVALDSAGRAHAYVLRGPGARVADIHPRNFRDSAALAVTAKGVVGGLLATSAPDALFTWDPRRERKMRIEVWRGHFRRLLGAGSTFEAIEVIDVNERLELVGRVTGTGPEDEALERFFYYSPPYGLLDVQELASAAGSGRTVAGVADVNNWGEILVVFAGGEGDGALVLSPLR